MIKKIFLLLSFLLTLIVLTAPITVSAAYCLNDGDCPSGDCKWYKVCAEEEGSGSGSGSGVPGTGEIIPGEGAPKTVPTAVSVIGTLYAIVNWIFTILLISAVISILISGFFFITSAGDPEKFKKARMFLLYAVIGVLVAVTSYALVSFVAGIAGFQGEI